MDTPSDIIPGLARRRMLATGLVPVALGLAYGGTAQAAPGVDGRKVWLDLDQAQLDAAYDQSKYAPNVAQVLKRYASNSDEMRRRIGEAERFSYGPTPIERLELYKANHERAPIHVHVHGGAWLQRPATEYAFPAEMFNDAGIHYVVFDFVSVDEARGSLKPMVEQVRRALAWVAHNAERIGGDPARIYVSGFSSGSHLAGVALITDWPAYDLPQNIIKGAVLSSGMYDLKPVRLSARSKYVSISDEIEQDYSTQRHIDRISTPLVLAHGTYETPEFQRQTRDFAATLASAGKAAELIVGQNYNHFEMMETLGSPYGVLGRAALRQAAAAP